LALSWAPWEDALLDYIWLKYQSFNDTLPVIVELLPHRIAPGSKPMIWIAKHIRKNKGRYENMDMSLKGTAIDDHLARLGYFDHGV
jgi:hypothetical protein